MSAKQRKRNKYFMNKFRDQQDRHQIQQHVVNQQRNNRPNDLNKEMNSLTMATHFNDKQNIVPTETLFNWFNDDIALPSSYSNEHATMLSSPTFDANYYLTDLE